MASARFASEALRQSWTAAGREALAMLRQATLLHRDVLSRPPGLPQQEPPADLVILLHGLFATAGVLRPLRQRIESETGALTVSFTYAPGTSVEELASRIAVLADNVPGTPRIHLVGHSQGGLAVRWYVQEAARDPRVVQTICLATPFAGSRRARLMPGAAGRELEPNSPLLLKLRRGAARVQIPHISLVAANDLLVEPGAWLESGERRIFPALGHNSLLYDPEVISEVVGRIRSLAERAESERMSGVRALGGDWTSREALEERLAGAGR